MLALRSIDPALSTTLLQCQQQLSIGALTAAGAKESDLTFMKSGVLLCVLTCTDEAQTKNTCQPA
jgi:hypothetical protein